MNSVIPVLPEVPILLLFNDADEGFPAACGAIFERRAEHYIDMECLVILGMMLADSLKRSVKPQKGGTRAYA